MVAGWLGRRTKRAGCRPARPQLVHHAPPCPTGVPPDMARQGSELMERSSTLAATVHHATLRAEALLSSAK